jgi:superfamily II DNA or RNA helicase
MRLLVNHSIGKLWRGILRVVESSGLNSKNVIEFLNTITKNGNKWRDEVVNTFLEDYDGTRYILDHLPKNYSYEYKPKLMQAYVAHKVLRNRYFMNLSGVGAGKTLSAILASRIVNSKFTVIVCPNDIVGQWEATIKKVFPDSLVYTSADPIDLEGGISRKAFSIKRKESKYQYVVINYEKFSLGDSRQLILDLTNQKIDFVILDEIHFAKKRGDDNPRYIRMISQRNTNLNLFRSEVKRHNRNVRVLGMTATPVINDLTECRSLIELVTRKNYRKELSTNASIRNAVAFYGKLQIMSVRELPNYHVNIDRQEVNVSANTDEDVLMLIRNPLKLEQILTEARIPEIIKRISKTGKTIIYTEYVDQILQRLREEVRKEGYSFTEYTGLYKELDSFVKGKAQVLIASKPISVGVDGLQDVCNNLIINTLPWTNAHYQQLVGRLVRRGQLKDIVQVHIIKSSINGYPYDERLKWNRIRWKRSLSDCVTDGVMPLKNLVSVAEAAKELKNWLERINRNGIMMIERKDIDVPLTQEEIRQRNRVFGDFANMNRQINKERSDTTHKRIQENPIYLIEYHRQMREAKNEWDGIIPARIIAEKIKILQGPRYMKKLIVGDFGCGECELSSILNENKVHSFDHHNILNEEKIKSCDMKDTSQYLKDSSIDVAVFSLSLMSTNWCDYIKEAKRVLVDRGYIFIAETTRSLNAKGCICGRINKLGAKAIYFFQLYFTINKYDNNQTG